MTTKEILLGVAAKLPPGSTLADAIYELVAIARFWHAARGFPHIPREG